MKTILIKKNILYDLFDYWYITATDDILDYLTDYEYYLIAGLNENINYLELAMIKQSYIECVKYADEFINSAELFLYELKLSKSERNRINSILIQVKLKKDMFINLKIEIGLMYPRLFID